jgi:UDPglucose 6-dehydrogenase
MLEANFTIWMRESLPLAQQQNIEICGDMYEATEQTDALCVITEWQSFYSPNLDTLKANMRNPIILDGRNLYDKQWLEENQFIYYGIGR